VPLRRPVDDEPGIQLVGRLGADIIAVADFRRRHSLLKLLERIVLPEHFNASARGPRGAYEGGQPLLRRALETVCDRHAIGVDVIAAPGLWPGTRRMVGVKAHIRPSS
jgi:hypothetical protein